jgi:DNA-binding PadR family transcriptional regulator
MGRRFFRHGELHLVVLALLEERPMHGYELMGELARLFGPAYRPSAGTIYPALEGLQAEGLVDGHDDGGRRILELTAAGSAALARRVEVLDALEVRTGVRLRNRPGVEASLARLAARVQAVAALVDAEVLDAVLDAAATEIEDLAAHPAAS